MKNGFTFSLVVAALVCGTASHASGKGLSPPIPETDHQAMREVRLDDALTERLVSAAQRSAQAHVGATNTWKLAQISSDSIRDLADRVMTRQPRLASIVKAEGFSPEEYVTAMYAVASARQVAERGPDNQAPLLDQFVSSQNATEANVAYYSAHQKELDAITVVGMTPPALVSRTP